MGRETQDTVAKSTSIAEEACGTMHIGEDPAARPLLWEVVFRPLCVIVFSRVDFEWVARSNPLMAAVRCFAAEAHENERYKKSMQDFYSIQRKEAHAYGG